MEGKLVAAGLVMVIAGLPVTTRAAQPANPPIEIIGESSGPPPQPICEGPGCATVLSIRYQGEEWVPVASEDGPGTYVGAAEGIASVRRAHRYSSESPLSTRTRRSG